VLSVPEVSTKTLVPPTNLSPYITGIFASLLCLFKRTPVSKSSASLTPKSGRSGTFGLNNHAIAIVAINFTIGLTLLKKLKAELTKPPMSKKDFIFVFFIGNPAPPYCFKSFSSRLFI